MYIGDPPLPAQPLGPFAAQPRVEDRYPDPMLIVYFSRCCYPKHMLTVNTK